MLHARRNPSAHPSMFALVLVTGIGPLAVDTYVAGLPELQHSLNTSATIAQLSLTAFIIGVGLGQITLGPFSDGHGRRPLLVFGTVVFTAASIACALAPTGPTLVAFRLVQGLVAGCGIAVGRAVVSDHYEGDAAAARYGTLSAIVFLGPVVAPAIGGLILTVGSWRTIFAFLSLLGVVMVTAVVLLIPESLPPQRRQGHGVEHMLARMADLSRDWHFMRHVVVQCLATAGFFTYIGGSSFVLETTYGITQTAYALLFATNAAAMALSSLVFRMLVVRVGAARLRTAGVLTACLASAGLVVVALGDPGASSPLALPWVLLCVVVASMGWSIPGTTALAQQAGRRSGGTAAALQGGLTFLVGALVTPLTGIVGYDSLLPMATLMLGFFALATCWLFGSGSTHA
ncbi:multidrug effflux MFS transporter [Angustibacter sp. McL0619]|uniref:multidrug effflux MFS transporter n=1 Tax=Angustibacter sp. McL0619 TaxID=3415676 RepID=UPI003CEBD1A2